MRTGKHRMRLEVTDRAGKAIMEPVTIVVLKDSCQTHLTTTHFDGRERTHRLSSPYDAKELINNYLRRTKAPKGWEITTWSWQDEN